MSIFEPTDRIEKWKYSVKNIEIIIPGREKSISIPKERLVNIELTENFEMYFYPLFKIELMLDNSTYFEIAKNKNKCKIQLRIDRFYTNIDSDQSSVSRIWLNDKFDMIMDEDPKNLQLSLDEFENRADYITKTKKNKDDYNNITIRLSTYLFKTSVMDGTKKLINKVIDQCSITDLLAYIFTYSKINNVLMAPLDNNKKYKGLLIPKMSVISSLQFLDTYYGFYKTGSIIYFGLDRSYVIPYSGKCKAWVKGENTLSTIIIPRSSDVAHSSNLGVLSKKITNGINYIIGNNKTLVVNNKSVSNNYINGNNIDIIDSDTGKQNKSNAKVETRNNKVFSNTLISTVENDMLHTTWSAQMSALSKVVTIDISDFDLTLFTPNKRYTLLFEDNNFSKEFKGDYILSEIKTIFLLSGDHFTADARVTLKLDNNTKRR